MNIKLLSLLLLIPAYLGAMDNPEPAPKRMRLSDLNEQDQKFIPLCQAVFNNDGAKIQELIKKEGTDIEAKNSKGNTILAIATYEGNEEAILTLLQHGARPEARILWKILVDKENKLGLDVEKRKKIMAMYAAFGGNFVPDSHTHFIMPDLIEAVQSLPKTALINAASAIDGDATPDQRITQFLMEKWGVELIFWSALHTDNCEIAEKMMMLGANPNNLPPQKAIEIGFDDMCALAQVESIEMAELLFRYGGRCNLKCNGTYPLHYIFKEAIDLVYEGTEESFEEIVLNIGAATLLSRVFIEYGADLSLVNDEGKTIWDIIDGCRMFADTPQNSAKIAEAIKSELRKFCQEKKLEQKLV